jgi:hypothetical protein
VNTECSEKEAVARSFRLGSKALPGKSRREGCQPPTSFIWLRASRFVLFSKVITAFFKWRCCDVDDTKKNVIAVLNEFHVDAVDDFVQLWGVKSVLQPREITLKESEAVFFSFNVIGSFRPVSVLYCLTSCRLVSVDLNGFLRYTTAKWCKARCFRTVAVHFVSFWSRNRSAIWGCNSAATKHSGLIGCCAVSTGKQLTCAAKALRSFEPSATSCHWVCVTAHTTVMCVTRAYLVYLHLQGDCSTIRAYQSGCAGCSSWEKDLCLRFLLCVVLCSSERLLLVDTSSSESCQVCKQNS